MLVCEGLIVRLLVFLIVSSFVCNIMDEVQHIYLTEIEKWTLVICSQPHAFNQVNNKSAALLPCQKQWFIG